MSLTDAFLLKPYPFEIWIAARTDGVKGSGTASDPYDGSFPAIVSKRPDFMEFSANPKIQKQVLPLAPLLHTLTTLFRDTPCKRRAAIASRLAAVAITN